jgi:hypothetical protein
MNNLYNTDFNLWLVQTARAIKNKELHEMDWDNLLQEIEDMGASQKRALRSYTKRLVEHILKLKYWEEEKRNYNHWRAEVVNFRDEIDQILKDSPSLKNYLRKNYRDWFDSSVKSKNQEFAIPTDCFIELDKILEQDFFA